MLHPLNPPLCIVELNYLTGLQRQTLEFACNYLGYTDADYQTYVGVDLVAWLVGRRGSGLDADKPVRRFFQELSGLIACNPADKLCVLTDFNSDQQYYQYLDDPTFKFAFEPIKTPAHTRAKACLIAFFEFLGISGYPMNVMAPVLGGASGFSKGDVVQAFKKANPWIEFVCPGCDNAFTDSGSGNAEGYTLEHYFPKALYPSICLHPHNLIPMCSGCNHKKEDNDPLAPLDKPTGKVYPVSYNEIFHPIKRPVRSNAILDFVVKGGTEDMFFVSNDPKRTYTDSIKAYELLYDIPPRWRVIWRRIEYRVGLSIKRALRLVTSDFHVPLDHPLFEKAVDCAIKDLEDQLGGEHLCYPAMRWLIWAKQNKLPQLKQSYDL